MRKRGKRSLIAGMVSAFNDQKMRMRQCRVRGLAAIQRRGRRGTAGVLTLALSLMFVIVGLVVAGPASAHTPSVGATCSTGVYAEGSNYETKDTNTLKVSVDGNVQTKTFGTSGNLTMAIPQDGQPHSWTASVTTTNSNPAYSKSDSGTLTCGEKPPVQITAPDVVVTAPTCTTDGSVSWPDFANGEWTDITGTGPGTQSATPVADKGYTLTNPGKVTKTVLPMLTGQQCAGEQPKDDVQTRTRQGTPDCTSDTVPTWQEQRTRSYSYDEAKGKWVPGKWSKWTKVEGSDSSVPATDEQCPPATEPGTVDGTTSCTGLHLEADNWTGGTQEGTYGYYMNIYANGAQLPPSQDYTDGHTAGFSNQGGKTHWSFDFGSPDQSVPEVWTVQVWVEDYDGNLHGPYDFGPFTQDACGTPPPVCYTGNPSGGQNGNTVSIEGAKPGDWLSIFDAANPADQTLVKKVQVGEDCKASLTVPPAECSSHDYQWDLTSVEPPNEITDTNGDEIADVPGYEKGVIFTVAADKSKCGTTPPSTTPPTSQPPTSPKPSTSSPGTSKPNTSAPRTSWNGSTNPGRYNGATGPADGNTSVRAIPAGTDNGMKMSMKVLAFIAAGLAALVALLLWAGPRRREASHRQ